MPQKSIGYSLPTLYLSNTKGYSYITDDHTQSGEPFKVIPHLHNYVPHGLYLYCIEQDPNKGITSVYPVYDPPGTGLCILAYPRYYPKTVPLYFYKSDDGTLHGTFQKRETDIHAITLYVLSVSQDDKFICIDGKLCLPCDDTCSGRISTFETCIASCKRKSTYINIFLTIVGIILWISIVYIIYKYITTRKNK